MCKLQYEDSISNLSIELEVKSRVTATVTVTYQYFKVNYNRKLHFKRK